MSDVNPNLLYASLFVEGLAHAGLAHVCIAPGSRSTPLTLTFDAHPAIDVSLHLDERCAAFYALGVALATDKPVALVCTSGSAAANFYPAIIEAMMAHVPLLLLTADRPHELRHSGANQTIDQVKMYGDNVLWAVDAPLPQPDAPDVALRNMQSLAARAYAVANGVRKGPVQVNFPFRKPLEPKKQSTENRKQITDNSVAERRFAQQSTNPQSPIPSPQSSHLQFTIHNSQFTIPNIDRGIIFPTDHQLSRLAAIIKQNRNGIIVCGPRCPDDGFAEAVAALSRRVGYPIFADPTSGVRYGEWVKDTAVLSAYETTLQQPSPLPDPDVVIRFGAVPISKWLNGYLSSITPKHRIHVRSSGVWADDSHLVDWFLQVGETAVCQHLAAGIGDQGSGIGNWASELVVQDEAVRHLVAGELANRDFDGAYVADVLAMIPAETLLFVGNSLPIRHLDQYGFARETAVYAYASRGASGIDGNVSTALGMQQGSGKKLVAVLGDVTFYHDLNGLLAVKQALDAGETLDVTFVLINNGGGGIFNRLPVAQFDPPFTELFLTPHGLDFEPIVRAYGLDFVRVNGRSAFKTAFEQSLADPMPRVIEVMTDNKQDDQIRKEINGLVKAAGSGHAA